MDAIWLNRELIDGLVEGIDFKALKYDPDTGLYCLNGEPFTGVTKTRGPDGRLRSIGHHRDGVDHGISVAWYASGQIKLYSEMENDVYHGWHIEWDEDGSKRVEAHYTRGRLDKRAGRSSDA
jgi:antitoxin component YwqK of YwqJK toxin-antitoxin module